MQRLEDPKILVIAILALFSAGLWVATWAQMSAMPMDAMAMSMDGMAMPMGGPQPGLLASAGMWILMMAAMMLPAMAPIAAVYAGISAKEDRGLRLALRIGLFLSGYFMLWAVFSVALAGVQLVLRDSQYFTMGGTMASPVAAGVLMIVAGLYQFTGIKELCLRHCRHPLAFLLQHWREGLGGAFPVGLRHGLYCFGCCVAFMGLMFVFGAMTLWWMAAIAGYFLAEKILPRAEIWGRIVGGALLLAGAATIIQTAI